MIGVADPAHPYRACLLARNFPAQQIGGVDLDVDEFAPGLLVPGKALHEAGIAIGAPVLAPHIGVDHT